MSRLQVIWEVTILAVVAVFLPSIIRGINGMFKSAGDLCVDLWMGTSGLRTEYHWQIVSAIVMFGIYFAFHIIKWAHTCEQCHKPWIELQKKDGYTKYYKCPNCGAQSTYTECSH